MTFSSPYWTWSTKWCLVPDTGNNEGSFTGEKQVSFEHLGWGWHEGMISMLPRERAGGMIEEKVQEESETVSQEKRT